jgi:hypothetical protein
MPAQFVRHSSTCGLCWLGVAGDWREVREELQQLSAAAQCLFTRSVQSPEASTAIACVAACLKVLEFSNSICVEFVLPLCAQNTSAAYFFIAFWR